VDLLQITAETAEQEAAAPGRGRPLRKGQSGNPKGRPRGSRNRNTLAAELLLDGEAEALARKAVELALGGDPTALRLCLNRTVAPRRERAVRPALPRLDSAADLAAIMRAITAAAVEGRITPGEAHMLAQIVATAMRAIEASDFEERLQLLEKEIEADRARDMPDPAYARAFARRRA
jgi:hypothetical protein